jgi:hypothetical protein
VDVTIRSGDTSPVCVPGTWKSSHSGGTAVQVAASQVALPPHVLPTAQLAPSGRGVCMHPDAASQVSIVQAFRSSQSGAAAGVHAPAVHVAIPLQTSPSSHARPSGAGTCAQPPNGSQESSVHGLPSSHSKSARHAAVNMAV